MNAATLRCYSVCGKKQEYASPSKKRNRGEKIENIILGKRYHQGRIKN
jgi:hypothetical protein